MMFNNKTAQPPYTEPSSRYDARPSPNATNQSDRIYLPTPIDSNAKHCLFISVTVVAVLGFVGNVLVSYHVSKKEKMLRLRGNINSTAFSRRLNYYIGSLVISDILCPAVTLPLLYLQLFTDVFQKDWHCKLKTYFYFVFPCVTINNLVVIAVERFLASWETPRRFNFSTVQRLIILAWLSALLITIGPVTSFKLVPYGLNATHFTVTCRYDNSVILSRVTMLGFTVLEFILPSILLIFCNIWVMKQAWQKLQFVRRSVAHSRNNHEQVLRSKGIFMLVAITFAFIIPYLLSFTYIMYNSIAKPAISFRTDYIIRCSGGILVTANSVINVIIYTVQLPDFRDMLKNMACKLFVCKFSFAQNVASITDEDNNPHEGRQEIEAGNADLNNGEEDKYNNFRDKTEQQRALSIEQYQVKESRRKPTFKGERHVAYKMEELQAAVVPKKKDACCQIVITVDVH